ncbi:MAG TPA: glycosyltransferase family 9 protein [Methylomusa anaerophila]|uniref:Lipopolysaccharide core heptosyltransferase RfaQ n=1 Tax=Methylomusa anaerophila TaxID=1930071 RepID=A0A348AKL4_9FIRM|nr:glycosyltransferase family 9 protein [Methylomusa anaerophila]BBB91612.1 lipopolysaccharide core heptosyltransferase RfaQ [Methylomusa anaerophila]HML89450.1 glycosyltransferase family 9 protein [Methylomusa anaerophila]
MKINKPVKKVFVAQRASLGDTLLSTPTLRAIKEKYPESRTIFLASPSARDILEGHPYVDELIVYEKGDRVFPIIKKIWRSDFALILDYHYRSSLFSWLARIPVRIGRSPLNKSFLTHQVLGTPSSDVYEAENTLAVARYAGIDTMNYKLVMAPLKALEQEKADRLLRTAGIDIEKDKLVVLAPYSLSDLKDWPEENYRQVIGFLKKHGYKPVLVGGKEHRSRASGFRGVYNFVGDTNIRETAYLISLAELVICGCTSVLHFAATTSTKAVAIYGPTTPVQWAPRQGCTPISKFLDCSPCYNTGRECERDKLCVRLVTAEEVMREVSQILKL